MDNGSNPSLLGWLAGILGAVFGVGGLAGWLLNRRRVPADISLVSAQAEVQVATAEKTRADAQHTVVDSLLAVSAGLKLDLDRIRAERDEARSQVKLLEEQLRREAAFRESHGLRLTD